jgi:hypothetical protein
MTGEWSGVWVSNVPLDGNEGAVGDFLLELEIPAKVFEKHEWVSLSPPLLQENIRTPRREALIPAAALEPPPWNHSAHRRRRRD